MNRSYIVNYKNREEELNDLFNTIETLFLIAISRLNANIEVLSIMKGEFYE